MQKTLVRNLVIVSITFLVACACNKGSVAAGTGASSGDNTNPDQVVATWGNGDKAKKLTLKEVDEAIASKIFDERRQQIEQTVMEDLISAEATKKGVSKEEWIKQAVEEKAKPPTDDEIAQVFAKNQAQMPPGTTLENVKPQIVQFLTKQQQEGAVAQVADDLRKANNVKVTFKEPRKKVEPIGPSRGPENAKVTIVEFSDFQCPYCGKVHDTVEQVMEAYPGKVRLVFRQFPLEFHPKAPLAAEAALCANEQGHFWDYHDVLFKNQSKLDEEDLKTHAATLGLDANKFADCLTSHKMVKAIEADKEAGKKVGVNGTPAFFINGQSLSGAQPLSAFKELIDSELSPN